MSKKLESKLIKGSFIIPKVLNNTWSSRYICNARKYDSIKVQIIMKI